MCVMPTYAACMQLLTNHNQPRSGLRSYIYIYIYIYIGVGHVAYIVVNLIGIRLRLVYPSELVSLCVVFVLVYLIKL